MVSKCHCCEQGDLFTPATLYYNMYVGPKPETVSDFWQMIVEHKPSVVVMLTKVDESGKVRCENCECVLLFCLLLCIWNQV